MDSQELETIYTRLKEVINKLNYFNLDSKLKNTQKLVNVASEKSFNEWLESIPTNLLDVISEEDNEDDEIVDELKDTYSVPYFHLQDNRWVSQIDSIKKANELYQYIYRKYKYVISSLSRNIVITLKYSDVKDLSDREKEFLNISFGEIQAQLPVLAKIEEEISNLSEQNAKINTLAKISREDEKLYEKFFYETNEIGPLLQAIESRVLEYLPKLKLLSIKHIQKNIRTIWQKLTEIEIDKESQLTNNDNLLDLFKDLPFSCKSILRKFPSLNALINTSNFELTENYYLTPTEANKLKQKAQEIYSTIKRKAYPQIANSDHLSQKEKELIHQLNIYLSFKNDESQENKLADLLKGFNLIFNEIADLLELAKNRAEANFLNDDDYRKWLYLEHNIYNNFSDVYLRAKRFFEKIAELKNTNKFAINKNLATYQAVISSIVGEQIDLSESTGLPSFVIRKVQETPLSMKNLHVVLRPYQVFGVKYVLTFKNVLLGDEMGLGKTIQSLTVANHLYQLGKRKIIIFVPYSIIKNWEREIEKHTQLPVYIFHGANKIDNFRRWKTQGGILLTNYDQSGHLLEIASDLKLDLVVVDEAHNIKNPMALRTQNISKILRNSAYKLLMTGTALENRREEMDNLITLLNPRLGTKLRTQEFISEEGYKRKTAIVYLRRKRATMLRELPELDIIDVWSELTQEQREYMYRRLRHGFNNERKVGFIGDQSEKLDQLKQICSDISKKGEKVVIFSLYKKDVIYKLQKTLPNVAKQPITGDITSATTRQEVIDEFSHSNNINILICQIQAAGVGLNIQAANNVILCEPQIKPSLEAQAISRVYRMGQAKKVTVYRLLTKNLDENMEANLQYKQSLFDDFADESAGSEVGKI